MSLGDAPHCVKCGFYVNELNEWCAGHPLVVVPWMYSLSAEDYKKFHVLEPEAGPETLLGVVHPLPVTRPSWDDVWMDLADNIARRSRCSRAKVGCVIVSPNQNVLSASYNGSPPNFPTEGECSNWCPRARGEGELGSAYDNCPAAHSEINGIARADHSRIKGATAYVTYPPCYQCAKALAAAGITRVVYRPSPENPHLNTDHVMDFLAECGVESTSI